jgi:recombination protein RecA
MARKAKNGFLQEIIDEYGDDILIRRYTEGVPVIPTGALSIDVSTGIGGIPLGRVSEIYGPEGGGKTTICLEIARNALLAGFKVLYVDTENSLDFGYTSDILGDDYDQENFLALQPKSGEDALKIAEAGVETDYKVIIFDSIASLSPEKELEDPFDKAHIGLSPRLTAKFLRRQINEIRKKEIAMIVTNQVRANIGSYLGDLTTPAGFALKHYTSLRIFMARSKKIEEKENEIGHFVKFIIKKNKLAKPFRTASTNIIYGEGINYYRDIISFGSLLGVIKTRGSYYAFEDDTIGLGVAKSAVALSENQELVDKIVEVCYNIAGVRVPQKAVAAQEEVDAENDQD